MTTEEIEARIEAEYARRMRVHSLQQVHRELQQQRTALRAMCDLPGLPERIVEQLASFAENEFDNLIWDVESATRLAKNVE